MPTDSHEGGELHPALLVVGALLMTLLGPLMVRSLVGPLGNVNTRLLPYTLFGTLVWTIVAIVVASELGVI